MGAKLLETGDTVKVGDIVAVTLRVSCPTDFMVLEDPIPAGMRVIESEGLKGLDPGDYHILPQRLWHMYGIEQWNGAKERLRVLP